MNVYAEYFTEDDINFRKITILQFGDSWDLIGSAILKNPGSASPLEEHIGDKELKLLKQNYPSINIENWKKFKCDTTMQCLEKVFNGYYVNKTKPLSGIIQLFNLHYVREANIIRARKILEGTESIHKFPILSETLKLIKDKPVYIGWFNEPQKLKMDHPKTFASEIFEHLKTTDHFYLEQEFSKNQFYHPMGVNSSYLVAKNKGLPLYAALQEFNQLTDK